MRYDGKPLLIFLDSYVRWAIGTLSQEELRRLEEMTPKLRSTFGANGTWNEIISSVMRFPPNMPDLIRGLWEKNLKIAANNHLTLDPQQFAERFVDENLVPND